MTIFQDKHLRGLAIVGGASLLLGAWVWSLWGNPDSSNQPATTAELSEEKLSAAKPIDREPALQRSSPAYDTAVDANPPRQVRVSVVDEAGAPVAGAHVLITTDEIHSEIGAPSLLQELGATSVLLNQTTSEEGPLAVDFPDSSKAYYSRVTGPTGLPADGPRRIEPGKVGSEGVEYVVRELLVGAFLLSDGQAPLFVDWRIESQFPVPQPALLALRAQLAEELALDPVQVAAMVPRSAAGARACEVAICHPDIGWFRSSTVLVPRVQFERPTVVVVPPTGHGKTVLVTVRCTNSTGEDVVADIRIMGEAVVDSDGSILFPRFGRTTQSGKPQRFPSGRIEVGFVDGSLAAMGMHRVLAHDDAVVTLQLPFSPVRLRLRAYSAGKVFRGPVKATVRIPALDRAFATRWRGSPDGTYNLSVPLEHECTIHLVAGDLTASLLVDRSLLGGAAPEVVVDLR